MRQKQVKKGPDESGPAAGDQNGNVHLHVVDFVIYLCKSIGWFA
ncbi:hypothetical protein [Aeromonas caviae]